MNGTRGIVMMVWGSKAYGYAARNLAISIKAYNASVPIHLIGDEEALKGAAYPELFDEVTHLPVTPVDPALCKIQIYDKLIYDHNLFLDVDGIALKDIDGLFDSLIADGREYRCAVHAWYDKNSPEQFPEMRWANKSVIWNHYGFTDEKLPATQSSIQYIKKGDFCHNLFYKMQQNYRNMIPVEKLRDRWGGGQPDELYLNVTLAQLGYDPTLSGAIYFGNAMGSSFATLRDSYYILSMFGTAQNIKKPYITGYDASLSRQGKEINIKPILWKYIAGAKIANKRTNVMAKTNGWGRAAFDKRYFKEAQAPQDKVNGTVHLYVSNQYDKISDKRKAELDQCMLNNVNNVNITKIFNYGNLPYDHPKVVNIETNERPTYQQFIDHANKQKADYTIISNSDLYFDNTIQWIDKINMDSTMLALCRYNIVRGRPQLEAYSWSQGTWIWKGEIKMTGIDYGLGIPGCDNAIAYDAVQQGYRVANPAKDIKIYHIHETNERNYTEKDRLDRNYLPVLITSITDLQDNNRVLINQPGAVGDILIVLPIAEFYAKQGYVVEWLCPEKFHPMFKYVDYVKPVLSPSGKYIRNIDLSFGINTNSVVHRAWMVRRRSVDSFVTYKYELAKVPVTLARSLNYTRDEKREMELYNIVVGSDSGSYSLVHDSSTYGDPAQVDTSHRVIPFKPIGDYTIFDWRKVIEGAKEIHCIDSSLCNFVDCLNVDAELFYYKTSKVPNKSDETILTKNWNRVNTNAYVG